MTLIQASDLSSYCLDQTEVTQGQYSAFLKAKNGDISGQTDPLCAKYNTTYDITYASDTGGGCPAGGFNPDKMPDAPVACVDWCDAAAYCVWAGKRLCGRIGGGTIPEKEGPASLQSEWYYACSEGGKTAYPYGAEYEPGKCDGQPSPSKGPIYGTPAKDSSCRGSFAPFDSIVSLSGNLAEWEDSCAGDDCRLRGGNSTETPENLACAVDGIASKIATHDATIGFRCCAN